MQFPRVSVDHITEIQAFYSGTDSNPCRKLSRICIAKLNSSDLSPGDLRYLHANNEMFGVACVKGQPTVRLIIKKKWKISNIIYYSNSVASFNFLELTILLSGDVHTMPCPVNATTGRMIPVLTRHRKPNKSTIQPCMLEILRILRML